MRSLPGSLPRVVARYRLASKCFLPGRRRYDVAYRKEHHVAMPIVAEEYAFVIGVDTHAATHSLALVAAATGGVIDEAVFPNTPSGLDRALTWIIRRIDGQLALVVIV
jgi:transposase